MKIEMAICLKQKGVSGMRQILTIPMVLECGIVSCIQMMGWYLSRMIIIKRSLKLYKGEEIWQISILLR